MLPRISPFYIACVLTIESSISERCAFIDKAEMNICGFD